MSDPNDDAVQAVEARLARDRETMKKLRAKAKRLTTKLNEAQASMCKREEELEDAKQVQEWLLELAKDWRVTLDGASLSVERDGCSIVYRRASYPTFWHVVNAAWAGERFRGSRRWRANGACGAISRRSVFVLFSTARQMRANRSRSGMSL